MNAVAGSGFGRTTMFGPLVEGALGALTLVGGVGTILSVSVGLLGSSAGNWINLPAIVFAWLPLVSTGLLAVGALLSAAGRPAPVAAWRWATVLGLSASTLMLLVASSTGVSMIPVTCVAYLTAGIGQVRARRGEAPESFAAPVLGGLATLALIAIAFLVAQTLAAGR